VANLAGVLVHAMDDFSLPDDGAPDSGADPEPDDALVPAGRAREVLAQDRHVDVIVEDDGDLELPRQELAHRESPDGDVGRAQDDARARIQRSGRAHADRDDPILACAGLRQRFRDRRDEGTSQCTRSLGERCHGLRA
jgi:hypothetical protein